MSKEDAGTAVDAAAANTADVAVNRPSKYSKKYVKFVGDGHVGEKDVKTVAGIADVYGQRLAENGFPMVSARTFYEKAVALMLFKPWAAKSVFKPITLAIFTVKPAPAFLYSVSRIITISSSTHSTDDVSRFRSRQPILSESCSVLVRTAWPFWPL